MAKKRSTKAPLPTREQVLDYIRRAPGRVGRREIARAFGIKGDDRIVLKEMMRSLEADGVVERAGKRVAAPGTLPEVTVLEIVGTDADGETLATPTNWTDEDNPPPRIYVVPDRGGRRALREGDRVLARLKKRGKSTYDAQVMRRVGVRTSTVIGIFRETRQGHRLEPTDRRYKSEYVIADVDRNDAAPGELVLAEVIPGLKLGLPRAKVTERLGSTDSPRAFSLIAIHSHDIPDRFPEAALDQAAAAKPVALGDRTDLRDLPLVTIDGADARDFDDAVWAEADGDTKNRGGWRLAVAIADVAHYVRPDDALDRSAYERGNSVYFPDRVVPMLPFELSNDLCSLRPAEDRACLVAHMWIGADGKLLRHRFERGLMRSTARLTYDQVQAAIDGTTDDVTGPLLEPVLQPLYGAFRALAAARRRRGALEIDLPERKAVLDEAGRIERIAVAERHDSHRVIEEFMIAANVAAAETLERLGQPCMYRVHDEPDPVKVEAVAEFLADLGLRLAKGQVTQPSQFNQILDKASGTPHAHIVAEMVLRCQSQAVYSPNNIGHFGLGLRRYAHFTSPIRRYSDLLVHRALIAGLKLGSGALEPGAGNDFVRIGEHISATERRAVAAERDTMDRYLAAYLRERQGEEFEGRITGVTRFGLFVKLDETGADGLIPMRMLPDDYYRHDERAHALVGKRTRRTFRLGERVEIRVLDANAVTGSTIFELVGGARAAPGRSGKPPSDSAKPARGKAGKGRRKGAGKAPKRKRKA